MSNYVSLAIATARKNNPNATIVESDYVADGQTFTLAKKVIPQNATISSLDNNDLQVEVSNTYPYKVVTPQDQSGATIIYSPSVETFVTASQNYYTKLKFERYQPSIILSIDKAFLELEAPEIVDLSALEGE